MERRKALQAIVFFSIAGNLLVSCKDKTDLLKTLGLKNYRPDDDTISLIEAVSNTLFPIKGHSMFDGHTAMPFVLTTLDSLYTKEEREKYIAGIKSFEATCKKQFNSSFNKLDDSQKLALLKEFNASKEESDESYFYNITKQQTIHYYTHTESYLRAVRKYEMAPGRFKGCLPIDQIESKKL